jgi:putative SOS response-associated peptidase YedK
MSTKLLVHAKAAQEVLYSPMENSPDESPKTKWRFSKTGEDWFCFAGL